MIDRELEALFLLISIFYRASRCQTGNPLDCLAGTLSSGSLRGMLELTGLLLWPA
tara:strand:+ start:2072 stop:2236 length:165 start_codon:yes stop_codon:yes gene_type:complete